LSERRGPGSEGGFGCGRRRLRMGWGLGVVAAG
jgi:hypothetical protein